MTDFTKFHIEYSSNPNSIVYRFNNILLEDSFKDYYRDTPFLEESDLIKGLFDTYNEIENIFVKNDFLVISIITKNDSSEILLKNIGIYIKSYFAKNKTIINKVYVEIVKKINKVIAEYINPAVAMDGGYYQLYDYSLTNQLLIIKPYGTCLKNLSSQGDLIQFKRIIKSVLGIHIKNVYEHIIDK